MAFCTYAVYKDKGSLPYRSAAPQQELGKPMTFRPQTTILGWLMVASVALPLALFGYASWRGYHALVSDADTRSLRRTEVFREYVLRLLDTVQSSLREAETRVAGLSDAQITEREAELSRELAAIASRLPHINGLWLLDATGAPLASNQTTKVDPAATRGDREYFRQALAMNGAGVFISRVEKGRLTGVDFFGVSRRVGDEGERRVMMVAVAPASSRNSCASTSRMATSRRWCAAMASS